jgi:hypothetical protein
MTWVSIKDRMPRGPGDILKVKRQNGDELKAYYHADRMDWLGYYTNRNLSYFQDHKTKEFLHDVTHWYEKEKD